MLRPILSLMAATIAISPAQASLPAGAVSFIKNDLHLTRYEAAVSDLNGDGRPEIIVRAEGDDKCGSGGCDLYILTPDGPSYRQVTTVSITRSPIRVLASSANGWHDLAVFVSGGGMVPGYEARLRFDGKSYPENPTAPPAMKADGQAGQVVIPSAANAPVAPPCPGATTPEVNACEGYHLDEADAELNRYYQAALQRLRRENETETTQKLVQSERSWMAYRDEECGAVFQDWNGGTIRVSMEIECRIRLTRLRTYAIWRHWLTYMDSTPPLLPRPDVEASTTDDRH